jgi:hypothetical protein
MEHKGELKEAADPLTQCEETVEHLKEENEQLRESAQTFGDLAERLNTWRKRQGGKPLAREQEQARREQ